MIGMGNVCFGGHSGQETAPHDVDPAVDGGMHSAFPSEAWFGRLAAVMRADEAAYRDIGPVHCTMVVQVDFENGRTERYEIVFTDYTVHSIRRLGSLAEAAPSHFVIAGPLAAWREMIENIREHGAPDLAHTLNSLTLPDVPLHLDGPDQLEIDAFYRYNASLQRFFNGAAEVPTIYAE